MRPTATAAAIRAQLHILTPQTEVVIIEDSEQALRRLESTVHEIPGLRVAGSAANPADGIALLSALRPAITVLDLYLIGGSGIEVLKAVGERGIDTQVVVVTNAPSAEMSRACRDLGARFFFDKTFEVEQFQEALRMLEVEAAGNDGEV